MSGDKSSVNSDQSSVIRDQVISGAKPGFFLSEVRGGIFAPVLVEQNELAWRGWHYLLPPVRVMHVTQVGHGGTKAEQFGETNFYAQ